jgi:hypothetical protein
VVAYYRRHAQIAASGSCVYRQHTGSFEQVQLMLSSSGTIQSAAFTLHPDRLRSGDLALLWGRPRAIDSPVG